MNEVLTRIYETLEMKRIRPKRLCDDTGISPSTFYTWKREDTVPKGENLAKIAEYLGVTTDWLLTGVTPEEEGYYYDPEVARLADELKNNTGMRILLDASRDLKMEELLEVIEFANKFRRKE